MRAPCAERAPGRGPQEGGGTELAIPRQHNADYAQGRRAKKRRGCAGSIVMHGGHQDPGCYSCMLDAYRSPGGVSRARDSCHSIGRCRHSISLQQAHLLGRGRGGLQVGGVTGPSSSSAEPVKDSPLPRQQACQTPKRLLSQHLERHVPRRPGPFWASSHARRALRHPIHVAWTCCAGRARLLHRASARLARRACGGGGRRGWQGCHSSGVHSL